MRVPDTALTMIVRNEGRNLRGHLPKVAEWFDEVIIGVDSSSTDDSLQAALECAQGAARNLVLVFPHEEFARDAHNRVQDQVKSPWTFMLDADEQVDEATFAWMAEFMGSSRPRSYVATYIARKNLVDGKPIGERTIEPNHVRLFRSDLRYVSPVHQWIDIKDGKVFRAPEAAMILHNKTSARQRRSNARVAAYEERFRGGQNGKPFKVNLGSGNRRIGDDWYNLDVQDLPNVDIVWDMTPQMAWNEHPYPYPGHLPFRDDSVDEVRAHHVLEHFSYHHVTDVLRDWVRVLKPGGRIELAFPDMEGLIGAYSKSNRNYLSAVQLLYGGQTNEWDRHYTAMDWQWIRGQLIHKGCDPDSIHRMPSEPERARPHEQELRVEARKKR